VQVPELLSPRYRNRVLEVSCRYRNHGVRHEPGFHIAPTSTRAWDTASLRKRRVDGVGTNPRPVDLTVVAGVIDPWHRSRLNGRKGAARRLCIGHAP